MPSLALSFRSGVFRARKLIRLLRVSRYRRALARGVAATVEHAEFEFLRNIQTVLDVGANRGQFACFALERFRDARVICFEPLPSEFRVLRHVEEDFRAEGRLVCYLMALGRTSGEAVLHIAGKADSSSLLPIGGLQTAVFPGTHEVGTLLVPVRRLDDVVAQQEIRRPSLLKIDVQGSELEVLLGAAEVLKCIDEVLVECSYVEFYTGQPLIGEVSTYLIGKGFRLEQQRVSATAPDGSTLQADVRFRRSEPG